MNIDFLGVIVGIIVALTSGLTFILNKIMNKTKQDTDQSYKIDTLTRQREECQIANTKMLDSILKRIDLLETKDQNKALEIISISQKIEALYQGHEKTQAMILKLQDHQQETFTELIKALDKGSK